MKDISLFHAVSTHEMEGIALEILRSGRIASGKYIQDFETALAVLLDQPNILTTIDMSSAIQLALYLSGVQEGDEVLTSAFSCMATNAPIATIGANAIWVDLAPNSAFISATDFEASITPNTKAAILYHLAGYPNASQEIALICKRRGIALIEDCNNAILAKVDQKMVGTFGDYAVYSFYPNRQINTTEGGVLACKNPQLASKGRRLKRFGIDPETFRNDKGEINAASDIPIAGWSISLNNFCAALGYTQLKTIESKIQSTRDNANWLKNKLASIDGIKLVQELPNSTSSYWVLLIQVENRDLILRKLKEKGVLASQLHQRNDIYSCFKKQHKRLPNTEELQRTIIGLPCGWWLSSNDLIQIINALKTTLKQQSYSQSRKQ